MIGLLTKLGTSSVCYDSQHSQILISDFAICHLELFTSYAVKAVNTILPCSTPNAWFIHGFYWLLCAAVADAHSFLPISYNGLPSMV